tara:strand:- start:9381 stop:10577 length:1197 start_codon:yes stop_codon:yes gene_type:complete
MAFKRSNFHIHKWAQSPISRKSQTGTNTLKRNSKMFRGTDALANKGQVIYFHRPNPLVDNEVTNPNKLALLGEAPDIYFKAFITAYNESFSSEWSEETVIGRADGLHMFKATSRAVSLGFQAPAATQSEAFENLLSLQSLIRMLYPSYTDGHNALSISQSPLVRVKIMNMLIDSSGRDETSENVLYGGSSTSRGVLVAVKNITVGYNLENDTGVIEITENSLNQMLKDGGGPRVRGDGEERTGSITGGTKKILPKLLDINMELDIIHESFLGWTHTGIYDEEGDDTYGPIFANGTIGADGEPMNKRFDMEFSTYDGPNTTTKHNINFPYGLGDGTNSEDSFASTTVTEPTSLSSSPTDPDFVGPPQASNLGTSEDADEANLTASWSEFGISVDKGGIA